MDNNCKEGGLLQMKWKKLGRILIPTETHIYVPTVTLRGNEFRIYASFWDKHQVKRIGFIDVSAKDPTKVLRISKKPALDVGEVGTFDSDGVTPSFILNRGNEIWLYYVGWQSLAGLLPRYLFAGLAISTDGGDTFERYQQTPILERLDSERFIRSTMSVLDEEFGVYRCWYTSSNKIIDIHGYSVPSYNIKHAGSIGGVKWDETNPCLPFKDSKEFGLSRPWVIKEDGIYKMFYSIRRIDKGYSIGYAESNSGYHWQRKDNEVGIEKSKDNWDSEMVCFPSIIDYEGKRYMFYSGDMNGEKGVGVAILEKE